MIEEAAEVKIGCCGWSSARAQYVRRFRVVEVQHTFYQPPQLETLAAWRAEAPAGFEFTLKAWMLITHESSSPTYRRLRRELTAREMDGCGGFRRTAIIREAWQVTKASAEALGARRVLFQCPARFTPSTSNIRNLRRFFTSVERPEGWEYLWEPRGAWPEAMILSLCRDLDLVHVVDPFTTRTVTPDRIYYRLHGRRGFRYVYEAAELEELYRMLPRLGISYVLFNNVRRLEDAARFQEIARRVEAEVK